MADKLTVQQAQAVYDRGGNLLVSAAAGSGKTKVLVDRLMTYLTDEKKPADLDEFLIITYTKAAASELRGKIASKLTERIAQEPNNRHLQKQMQRLFLTKISTVHGFCSDLLREYAYKLDLPADFRVADENECREIRTIVLNDLMDTVYGNALDDVDFRTFVDTQGLGRDDRLVPEIIQKVYDSARCHMDPGKWLEESLKAVQTEGIRDVSETVWGKYLIEDLFVYLDCHIRVLDQCIQQAQNYTEMDKAVYNLKETMLQLELLRRSQTWDEIVANKEISYGRLTFPRKNPDTELTERIKSARNACKKGLERKLHSFSDPSVQILKDLGQSSAGVRGLIDLVQQFECRYSTVKKNRRCLDFSDLEHKTLDLLLGKSRENPSAAAAEIGRRYREIMVDEYQDSNGVQDAIFMTLSRERHNCFLVGDVKQSIYQFRLADPGIFLEKYHAYVPAETAEQGQGRKVLLSHNFRSGREVIEAVNDVFSKCMSPDVGGMYYGEEEALREGIPHDMLSDPAVELYAIDVQVDTYAEEAAFTADRICQMLRDGTQIRKDGQMKSVEPDDIVILLRSPGSTGEYFRRALEERGVRCSSGGGMDLLQTEEVATLLSFLQTIMNPRQDIPLISVLASPLFGFTADDLASFRSSKKRGTVYDALRECKSKKAKDFLDILATLRKEARMNTLTALLEQCFRLTHIDSIYAAMADGEVRSANLQAFYQLAADYEKGSLRDLSQFLEHMESMKERGLITNAAASAGTVSIMSIHKSKGLEFPVVFLCNLSRRFNQEDLRGQILCDKELGLGLSVADMESRTRYPSVAKRAIAAKMASQSVSEEMRVLYVAMTRARDRLVMTYASQSLEADLQELALRMDFDNGDLLCRDAICLGDWVMLEAMTKMEAGELHALGGRPKETQLSEFPWAIRLVQQTDKMRASVPEHEITEQIPEGAVEKLKRALAFQYEHMAATSAPSKQTATGKKGRIKDEEAAEQTWEPKNPVRTWRRPSFQTGHMEGKAVGNAIHQAMQYLRYKECNSLESVEKEVARLINTGFLTEEQAAVIDCSKIMHFFSSDIGKKLRMGIPHLREYKFSILDRGDQYGENLQGEHVLLQGVVDCALIEPDGITVLDFKSDHVTEQSVEARTECYRSQVDIYADALSRIYEMPVKEKLLYFFQLNRFVPL